MKKLNQSINMILANVFHALLHEKKKSMDMGASVFGLGEIHDRFLDFKSKLKGDEQLYFVKVDIKQAFDTIRHDALMRIIQEYLTEVLSEFRLFG